MASIEWLENIDEGLAKAKAEGKPVLLDFSAAPT
jgi:hypothetical protein